MKKRKILLGLIAIALFFQIGLMFRMPVKTHIVEHYINDPIIIYKTAEQASFLECESRTTHAVGIYTGTTGSGPIGELIGITLSLCAGKGETYIEVSEQLIATDFQEDLEDIRDFAEQFTHESIAKQDLFVTFDANANQLSGTSGGAAMTMALIAIIENKTLVDNVVLTGGFSGSGKIMTVEELEKKIQVMEEEGAVKILIPETQCNQAPENTTIEIICVATIQKAMEHMIE